MAFALGGDGDRGFAGLVVVSPDIPQVDEVEDRSRLCLVGRDLRPGRLWGWRRRG